MPLTPEQIADMDAIVGGRRKLTPEMIAEMDAIVAAPELPREPSLMDDINIARQNRMNAISQQPDLTNALISTGRYAAGGIVDPAAAVISHVTPEPIKKALSAGIQKVANLPLYGTEKNVGDFVNEVTEEIPYTAKNILGLGADVGGALGAGISAKAGKSAINKVGLTLKERKAAKAAQITGKEARKIGGDIFKAAEAKGGEFNPEFTKRVVEDIQTMKPTTAFGKLGRGSDPVDAYMDELDVVKEKPMTLRGMEEMDSNLGDFIDAHTDTLTGDVNNTGRRYLQIQQRLRKAVKEATDKDTPDKSAFEAIEHARGAWEDSYKMRDIERVIKRAELTDNPASAMKTGFRRLYLQAEEYGTHTPEELKLLKKAAQTGVATGLLRVFGSRLISTGIGFGTGGVPGAVAAQGAGAAMRAGADKLQAAPAKKLLNKIGGRVQERAKVAKEKLK